MNTTEYLLSSAADDAVAIADGPTTSTYNDLRGAVGAHIEALTTLGLEAGAPVAIVAPNGLFWIAAYLATLALGLVAVPLPTVLTRDEMIGRLRWIGARVAFLGGQEARRLGPTPVDLVVFDEPAMRTAPANRAALELVKDVDPDQDAAYLFTSGTTGEPRAVRITHRNIQSNTESILAYLNLTRSDRMMVFLPFSYVFGASLLHTHLRVGAALVNQPNFVYLEAVVEKLAHERCTGIAGVPSNFHALMRNSSFGSRTLPDLRLIQQAGGRMSPTIISEIRMAHPDTDLFVMYGQTEATARLSYLPPGELERRMGSIGKGIPGVTLRVVSDDGSDVAPGEVGEIWATGANISPGYLRDPERTAQKMPGGILHTGDLATVDQDGYIYVVDRAEDFIKSWGHRIASQDVESAIMEIRDVISVAAVGVPDPVAGERVAVAVVKRPGSKLIASEVIEHAHRRLAKHMVPDVVLFLDSLPLNASGKVVKRQVRDYCAEHAAAEMVRA